MSEARLSWRYWSFHARYLASLGQYKDVLTLLEEAKHYLPASAIPWREQARIMEMMGEVDEADKLYKSAVETEPDEDISLVQYARFLFKRDRLVEAKAMIEKAILHGGSQNDARWADHHVLLGKIYHAMGDVVKAQAAFNLAYRLSKDRNAELFLMKLNMESAKPDEPSGEDK